MNAIGAGLLCAAGLIMIPCFIHWLITPPREQFDFDHLKRKERK